jgi:CRP-like cAMP-binding protein
VLYPGGDIAAARWALERGHGRARASAAEFLDTLLKGEIRKRIILVVEDLPLADRVQKANVLLRSRPRDVEETVASLIHEDDTVVSSAAIQYVETRRMWALAGDLEHILEHRDVRDWMVFEAATWALASHRMSPTDRHVRWRQPLPAVEVANRLRRAPAFAFVPIDELHRIAASGRQRRYPAGHRLLQRGARSSVLQFLLDGSVCCADEHGDVRDIEAPGAVGFETTLDGTAATETITTVEPAILLELTSDVFHGLLSDNILLSHGLFRMLTKGPSAAALPRIVPPRVPVPSPRAGGELQPLEKVLTLEAVPLFARATADDLRALASIASEKPIRTGADLLRAGEPAAIHTVIAGRLQISGNGTHGTSVETASSGDTIGIVETLGGQATEEHVTVLESGSVLCLERTPLFDLLSARTDLLCGMFGSVQAATVDTSRSERSTRRTARASSIAISSPPTSC